MLDETHDPSTGSWLDSANEHTDFPLQNLPMGVFSRGAEQRGGVAIGDRIVDVGALADAGLLTGAALSAARVASGPALNEYVTLAPATRLGLRRQLFGLLRQDSPARERLECELDRLMPAARDCTLHIPVRVGNYTDFFAGIHHAVNAGRRLRPGSPLTPNYKFVPIGYHGRASSVQVAGGEVRRPHGQRLGADGVPEFGPTHQLDFELELALWISEGNALGTPIPIAEAANHLAGIGLLCDWSARDIQRWEAQPLGPFLSKSFLSTVSPWIVTPEALEPFRVPQPPRPADDPRPLPYLWDEADQAHGAFALELEITLRTARMRSEGYPAGRISRTSSLALYWTAAQLIAHHTSNGCNLQPGDLLGTGTVSGETPLSAGCLLELTDGGQPVLRLQGGESRGYLEAGDEVVFRAHAKRSGFVTIGLGELRGVIAD